MKIGVISEGHADRAVIINILAGVADIDASDIVNLRPTYTQDETDRSVKKDKNTFSTYSVIKEECERKELMDGFFAIEGNNFVTVHIDTAEADSYGVNRPKKDDKYCDELRAQVLATIAGWLGEGYTDKILHAIAIEETDAWVLTIYEPRDSSTYVNAKERLNRVLSRRGIGFNHDPFDHYHSLSEDFSSKKKVRKSKFYSYNRSLYLFVEEVKEKLKIVDSSPGNEN